MKKKFIIFTSSILLLSLLSPSTVLTTYADNKLSVVHNISSNGTNDSEYDLSNLVVSSSDGICIYEGLSKDSPVVGILSYGSAGHIVERVAEDNGIDNDILWVKVSSGSVEGYIDSSILLIGEEAKSFVEANNEKNAVVNTSTGRIYDSMCDNKEILDILPNGTLLKVVEVYDEWVCVDLPKGNKGFISIACLDIYSNLEVAFPTKDTSLRRQTYVALPSSSSTELVSPYDPLFSFASINTGVPIELLKAVAKCESSFDSTAISSSGAVGIMQLMEKTALAYGCEDRYNAMDNIMAGAMYLADLIKRFEDIELALAAYNCGPSNIDKFGGIPPFKETIKYIEKVLSHYNDKKYTVTSLGKTTNNISSHSSGLGSLVALYACQFVGNNYLWGGNDLDYGIDCSGFVKEVYQKFGVTLPRYSGDLRNAGVLVSESFDEELALPGDIICYEGHVAIYLGKGNGIVHAANESSGIKISPRADYRPVVNVRRIFN